MAEVSIPSDFSEGGQLFVRNATGLVREVSKWDALIMNTLGMNVALGAVFMMSPRPSNLTPPPPETPAVGENVNTPTKQDVAANVKSKLSSKPTEKIPPSPDMPKSNGPIALKPKQTPYTPTPSDSMTSGQWWSDETPKDYNSLPDSKPSIKPPMPASRTKGTP